MFVPPAEKPVYCTHAGSLIIACSEPMWRPKAGVFKVYS